jgi:hypothetical protein
MVTKNINKLLKLRLIELFGHEFLSVVSPTSGVPGEWRVFIKTVEGEQRFYIRENQNESPRSLVDRIFEEYCEMAKMQVFTINADIPEFS